MRLILATERGVLSFPDLEEALWGVALEAVTVDAAGVLFVGSERGEIYQSRDGMRWNRCCGPFPGARSLWSLVAVPKRSGHLYCGVEPVSLWASEDGGRKWELRGDFQEHPARGKWHFFRPMQPHVRAIATEPDGERVYVGIEEGGFLASEDFGRTFKDRSEGVDEDLHSIVIHPEDPDCIFALTGGGLFATRDRGGRWRHLKEGLDRGYLVPMLILPESGALLAGAGNNPPPAWRTKGADASIYRSLDRGDHWEETEGPFPLRGMLSAMAADRISGKIYAGTTDGVLLSSGDLGRHWEIVMERLPRIEEMILI